MSIWIVEMWNEVRRRYEPTIGVGLTRQDARGEARNWRYRNPGDRFRVVRYARGGK